MSPEAYGQILDSHITRKAQPFGPVDLPYLTTGRSSIRVV